MLWRKQNLNGKSSRKDARIADGLDERKMEEQEETEELMRGPCQGLPSKISEGPL